MKFKFIGNPFTVDNIGAVRMFGMEFPYNVAVNVTNEHVIKKLMGNNHFAMVDGGKTYHQIPTQKLILPESIEAKPASTETPTVETGTAEAKMDRAAMIAFAEQHGIKIDRRWNDETIIAKIDEAARAAEAGAQTE